MSATQVPLHPLKRGTLAKFWLGFVLIVAAALLLAWTGAGAMRGATTSNGVRIVTLVEGKGDPIKAVDGAIIEYEGRLPDGTVFDSTAGRGPAGMIPGQVIPGFGEALQQMREGGRYKITIPAALGYGATGTPDGTIPPNSDLEFDIEVKKVVRDAALMAPQVAPGQPEQQPEGQPQP
ncbi:MAG: FKBP-type peptidyl-prolyl cis-trans isomerase [Sphingomicrobium sp.]